MGVFSTPQYQAKIGEIRSLDWAGLDSDGLTRVAWAYYYFSIQFRENLEIARRLHPGDAMLAQLEQEECGTDNLSPWPGVAEVGERMNHDEFMRRLLRLSPIPDSERLALEEIGRAYLATTRGMDPETRALSIASYEDGGLENVFGAILTARHWDGPLLRAFQHFLLEHIKFDSNPEGGHGVLSRHLTPDDRVFPLWAAFERLLLQAVPRLRGAAKHSAPEIQVPLEA